MTAQATSESQGFWEFYREYAQTGIHAATAAALTGLIGFASVVGTWFVVVAIAVYVLPLAHFYLAADRTGNELNIEGPTSTPEPREREPGSTRGSERDPSTEPTSDRADEPVSSPASGVSRTNGPAGGQTADSANDGRSTATTTGDGSTHAGTEVNTDGEGTAADDTDCESGTDTAADVDTNTDTDADAGIEPDTGGENGDDEPETNVEIGTEAAPDAEAEAGADVGHDVEAGNGAETGTDTKTDDGAVESDDAASRDDMKRGGAIGAGDGSDSDAPAAEPEWATVDSPTDEPLYNTVVAGRDSFAVGDDGTVLARRAGGWETVLDHGPTTESNPLWGIDATDDGERVWFCGDSGVLGQYGVSDGRLIDRSAPRDLTDSWEAIAVVGPAGNEDVSLVNGSGEVLVGHNDAGDLEWTEPTKPGSGSSLSAIEFRDREMGYCCDTSQGVFETTDGGGAWGRIGIDGAGIDFTDLAVTSTEVVVAGGDGSVFRYDDPGWTKLHGGEATLFAIDLSARAAGENGDDLERGLAVGDDGTIRELRDNDWTEADSPTDETLCGVSLGSGSSGAGSDAVPNVAVGDDGMILERGG